MKTALWEKAARNRNGLYGESLPTEVLNRFETEKAVLTGGDVILFFQVLAVISTKAKEMGEHILIRGNVGASFTAYLLGATEVNPLPAHYRCPNCKKAEFIPGAADGWDLPPKKCACGHAMLREGHAIPFGMYKNILRDAKRFDLSVSHEFYGKIEDVIDRCCTDYSVSRTDADGVKTFRLQLKRSNLRNSAKAVITVLPYAPLDLCRKLEQYTGTSIDRIPPPDERVLEAFRELHTDGIPEFSSDFVKKRLQEMPPQTYAQLLKIPGLAHSFGAWGDSGEPATDRKIAYRDDVYTTVYGAMLQKGYAEPGIADRICEILRKGGVSGTDSAKETETLLVSLDLPAGYAEVVTKLPYLFPKAHGMAYMRLSIALMWYKLRDPALFAELS